MTLHIDESGIPLSGVPKSIAGIIFDVGGVLATFGQAEGRSSWASKLGLDEASFREAVWEATGSRGVDDTASVVDRISTTLGIESVAASKLLADFNGHWLPNRDLLEFLRSLRPAYRTAALSNAYSPARYAMEQMLDLHRSVDVLAISAEIGVEKPASAAYDFVSAHLGLSPHRCLFIDDVADNVDGARATGMSAFVHETNELTLRRVREWLSDGNG